MNRKLIQSRSGVTLLFVVSMIVLFLLMGTTFVVVANNFTRSSKIRNQISIDRIESLGESAGERAIQRALFDLLRGPDIDNVNSPLRGQSILADMYGYGMTSYVKNVENDLVAHGSTDNEQFLFVFPNFKLILNQFMKITLTLHPVFSITIMKQWPL